MKLYTMSEIDDMYDDQIEDILRERSNKFISVISKSLKGQEIEAFGKSSKGLWGGNDESLTFKIKSINAYGDGMPFQTEEKKKPYYLLSLDVHLAGYSDDKPYGMMYTDNKGEQSLKALFKELLGNDCKVSWSEQGMQGDKHVNIDFQFPANLIAPDFIQHQKVQAQVKKLQEEANKAIGKKLTDNWPKTKIKM